MWNWAEEWKEKLNQALIDWQNLRKEEAALLSWLSSKEQTFDLIGETDITNEEQVTMHLNLLEVIVCNFFRFSTLHMKNPKKWWLFHAVDAF